MIVPLNIQCQGALKDLVLIHTIAVLEPAAIQAGAASATTPAPAHSSKEAQNTSFWDPFRLARADQGTDAGAGHATESTVEEFRVTLPEVLVHGSKSLNFDIQRSRDGVQPYVVFDRGTIEHSGAQSVQEFLQTRLTSNSAPLSPGQGTAGDNHSFSTWAPGYGSNRSIVTPAARESHAGIQAIRLLRISIPNMRSSAT